MKSLFKNKSENKNRSEIKNTTWNILEYATDYQKQFRSDNSGCPLTVYGKF